MFNGLSRFCVTGIIACLVIGLPFGVAGFHLGATYTKGEQAVSNLTKLNFLVGGGK